MSGPGSAEFDRMIARISAELAERERLRSQVEQERLDNARAALDLRLRYEAARRAALLANWGADFDSSEKIGP